MNEISTNSLDRLFTKPVAIRDEPSVENTSIDRIDDIVVSHEDPFQDHVTKQKLLAEGFDSIVIEYNSLLDVLIKRANMRGIKLDLSGADVDPQLAQAIVTLFGAPMKSLSFEQYLDILKYQQQVAVTHTKGMLDPSDPNIPDFQGTPEVHACDVVKKAFKGMLKDNNAPDLLLSDSILQGSYSAASKKALIIQVNNTTGGGNNLIPGDYNIPPATDPATTTTPAKNTPEQLSKNCIPCFEASIGAFGQWPKHGTWAFFNDSIWKQWLAQLEMLARLKLSLTDFDMGKELCQMASLFSDFKCLPDLAALLALIAMMLNELISSMFSNYSLSASVAINEMVGLIIGPILDAIVALLVQVLNSVLSPIECVLDSLNAQFIKLYPVIEKAESLAGAKAPNIQSVISKSNTVTDKIHKTIGDLYAGKNKIETKLTTFINEQTKDWKIKSDSSTNSLDLYDNIQKLSRTYSVVMGIIKLFKQIESLSLLTGAAKDAALRDICEGALVQDRPWLTTLKLPSTPLDFNLKDFKMPDFNPLGSGPSTPVVDTTGNVNDVILNGTGGLLPNDGNILSDGNTAVIDSSIPDNFFDGNDIETFLNDPRYADIIGSLSSSYSPEDGDDPLALDGEFIANYISTKQKFKDTLQAVRTIQAQNNSAITPTAIVGVPTTIIEFGSCLKGINSGYSQEQINEWIVKITG